MGKSNEKINKIQNIFEKIFKEKINNFEKLEFNKTKKWDSLKHIQLIVSFEKELAVKIKTSDVEKLTSYKKIINYFL
jgi:acyl carrier protein